MANATITQTFMTPNYLQTTQPLIKKAGGAILKHYKSTGKVSKKSARDILTQADLESEQVIISGLKECYPNHNILSEETRFIDNNSDYTWIIDPLDGTLFFSRHMPLFSISIALEHKNKMIFGLVYVPVMKELFWAELGKGAYINGNKIKVTPTKKLSDAFVIFDYSPITVELNQALKAMRELSHQCFFVRSLACTVIDFVYVACGRFDTAIIYATYPWDYAASGLILQEAGGMFTDHQGKKVVRGKNHTHLVASNKHLHRQVLEFI